MPVSAREAALNALKSFRRSGTWSENALNDAVNKYNLDSRDAALAFRICYGVLQNMALCDWYISCYSTIRIDKIQPQILDVMRISVFQIVFLNKIPHSAAVNEAVTLAKKLSGSRASGFVNAVLRKISLNADNLPEFKSDDPAERLSVLYSHPKWLCSRMITLLGAEGAEQFLYADNLIPPMYVHLNPLSPGAAEEFIAYAENNPSVKADKLAANCFQITGGGNTENIPGFKNGGIYVQDPAAHLAVSALDLKPGMKVLDGCAAPGGKSFAAAVAMQGKGSILSCDISEKKLKRIREGAGRLNIGIIDVKQMDAREYSAELCEGFDAVIADVPCSGMGVIRKKPEIRYKKEAEISKLPEIQFDILSNLSKYVKRGGVLLYSTCTVFPEENEEVVKRFLKGNDNFVPEALSLPKLCKGAESGMFTFWPHIHGTDGFFAAKLRRKM